MYFQLKKLYQLLNRDQRIKLLRLQILVVIMAFAEVGGVFAIGPFMALVADMSALHNGGVITEIFELSGISERSFIFWTGVTVLLALTIAALISMITTWRLASYSFRLGAELGVRLFKYYMQQQWLFHASGSSSTLINKISAESNRLTTQIINPVLQLIARLILILTMAIAILVYNPVIALSGLLIFSTGYLVLYRTARKKLQSNGKIITLANRQRMNLMQEGFGGIKDTLLLGRQADFNQRFEKASLEFGEAQGNNAVLAQVPRYAMELLAFGTIIVLVLYLLSFYDGELSQILPILAVYSLAGFRLLPAFQQVYVATTSIRGNISAFENLLEDFELSQGAEGGREAEYYGKLLFSKGVSLENIRFCYPGKSQVALDDLNIYIPAKKVIGIVGASGSGKSTAIDILLGLIEPDSGVLSVDGKPINSFNKRAWQNNLGYVSQSIFLGDLSIKENIAFGLPPSRIDEDRVVLATKLAHLDELISSLPLGLDTMVGERGIQLSGGQRQRIGIARALYSDADMLVFDEATSALDGITEQLVMEAIHDFTGKKTIVLIAHRLSTVKDCDCIYLMDKGTVVEFGTYNQLIENNSTFRKMALLS